MFFDTYGLPTPRPLPPNGWSHGFWALPDTWGFLLRFHLPFFSKLWNLLLTIPNVAKHSLLNFLISFEGNCNKTKSFVFLVTIAKLPALLTIFPPCSGINSILYT